MEERWCDMARSPSLCVKEEERSIWLWRKMPVLQETWKRIKPAERWKCKWELKRILREFRTRAASVVCNTCTNKHRRYATFMHIGLEQANAHIKTSNSLSLPSVFSWTRAQAKQMSPVGWTEMCGWSFGVVGNWCEGLCPFSHQSLTAFPFPLHWRVQPSS